MDEVEYWKRRATDASDEYDELIAVHRTQTESLRRQCAELLHERSLMKAATASDVRAFILNYQADARRRMGSAATSSADSIPVNKILQFLHEYSNGLVPAPRNERKRDREAELVPATPALNMVATGGVPPQRLYHRLMLRRRQNFRDFEMEEWMQQQQQQHQHQHQQQGMAMPELDSTSGSPMTPELVAHAGSGIEEITAQLQREEQERQLEDERAQRARGEDATLLTVGGADSHTRRKHGHARGSHGHAEDPSQ